MGCKLRITSTGTIAFRLYWRGAESQEGTGMRATTRNLERARVLSRKLDALVRSGAFTEDDYRHYFAWGSRREILGMRPWHKHAPRAARVTVGAYADRWLDAQRPPVIRENLHRDRRNALNAWVRPHLATVALADLTPAVIERWQADLLARGLALNSVKHAVSTLRALWRHARANLRDELAAANPFSLLAWPRPVRIAPNPIPPQDAARILDHFARNRPIYYPFVRFLLDTGARPSEATGLCWRHVDLDRATAVIEQGKVAGEIAATKTAASTRTIALAPGLVDALRSVPRGSADAHVFLNPRGNPIEQAAFSKWIWLATLRALGLPPRRLYTTRHTYISQAITAGANPKRVAEYVGTSIMQIENHYGRFMGVTDLDPLTDALRRNPDTVLSVSGEKKTIE